MDAMSARAVAALEDDDDPLIGARGPRLRTPMRCYGGLLAMGIIFTAVAWGRAAWQGPPSAGWHVEQKSNLVQRWV